MLFLHDMKLAPCTKTYTADCTLHVACVSQTPSFAIFTMHTTHFLLYATLAFVHCMLLEHCRLRSLLLFKLFPAVSLMYVAST